MATIQAQAYEARELTLAGQSVLIRSIRAEDKPILQEGMHHLSKESLYARFFTFKSELSDVELKFFTEMDFVHHVGLMATLTTADGDRPVGVGRYIMSKDLEKDNRAELAFAVDDEYQGLGIGTLLLKHLTVIGKANKLSQFVAFVLPTNRKMLGVLRQSGLPIQYKKDDAGVLEVTLDLK